MKEKIIRFEAIKKSYSKIEALKNISFSVPVGSIFGILGANGSGKSTLMKILPGLIKDWSGKIYYKDKNIKGNSSILKRDVGYLIESPTFYEYISAQKNLEMLARISNVDFKRIPYVLDLVELKPRANDKVSDYSYGMKQRLGIAQVLLHNPQVVVLDEPNNGLDPNGISDMTKLIKQMQLDGKTVILSTHNLRDVEEICTDFVVFKNGESSDSISIKTLLIESKKWSIIADNPESAIDVIKNNKSLSYLDRVNNKIFIESKLDISINDINNLFKGLVVYNICKESNLIDYFSHD